jgi:hypothetical protein
MVDLVKEKFDLKKSEEHLQKFMERKFQEKKNQHQKIMNLSEKVLNKNLEKINQSLNSDTELFRSLFWLSYLESMPSDSTHTFAKTKTFLLNFLFNKEQLEINKILKKIDSLITTSNPFKLHNNELIYQDLLEHVMRQNNRNKPASKLTFNIEDVFAEQVEMKLNSVLDTAKDNKKLMEITGKEFDSQEECDEYLNIGITKMELNLGFVSNTLKERLYHILLRSDRAQKIKTIEDQVRSMLMENYDWIENIFYPELDNLFARLFDEDSEFWLKFNVNLFKAFELKRKRIKYEHLYQVYASDLNK